MWWLSLSNRIDIPAAYKQLWEPKRYKVYYGGRGGGKSWSFAMALLLMGAERKLRVLCAREIQHSIRESVHRLLADTILRAGIHSFYQIMRDSILGRNGSEFIFAGIRHDPMQIKSLEGIDICWIEEAQKVSRGSWDVLIPTIRKEGSEIWVSFNPDLEDDITYQMFVAHKRDDCLLVKVNYTENPFITKSIIDEIDYMKKIDYEQYLHVYEGECAKASAAQIFKGKFVVEDFDTPKDIENFYFGMDFGFSQDPTAIVRCFIVGDELYIDYEDGGVQIELDHTYKLIDTLPLSNKYVIRGDSARPESISFIRRQGYRIESVDKWTGSVEDGIEFIRSFRMVHIHSRCRETASEFLKYSYKIDRVTEDILPIVLDKWNHYIDALRYALAPMIKRRNMKPSIAKVVGY